MSYVIRVLGLASEDHFAAEKAGVLVYVLDGNVDYMRGGRTDMSGIMTFTKDVTQAKRFSSFSAASEWYTSQSTVVPIRGDGKPNRPFMAYTVSMERVDEPAGTKPAPPAPGAWIMSIYGTIGIVEEHADCQVGDAFVHARYTEGTDTAKPGDEMHVRNGFWHEIAADTKQDPQCKDPMYWAMMV